jgi:hypothetical protein
MNLLDHAYSEFNHKNGSCSIRNDAAATYTVNDSVPCSNGFAQDPRLIQNACLDATGWTMADIDELSRL